MLENLKRSGYVHGLDVKIFPFPTNDAWLQENPSIYRTVCWKYKIPFIMNLLLSSKEDLLWIDGDCLIVKPLPAEEVLIDCDIAFTLRDIQDREKTAYPEKDGLINAGVMFIRNNEESKNFFIQAGTFLLTSYSDQDAINRAIMPHSRMDRHCEIINVNGCRIKLLNCREFNNFYFHDRQDEARILHFKGRFRSFYDKYNR